MKTLEEYMKMPWRTEVHKEETPDHVFFVASNPELFSCLGQGNTPAEALADLKEARRDLLAMMINHGDSIPEPKIVFNAKFPPAIVTNVVSEEEKTYGPVATLFHRHAIA